MAKKKTATKKQAKKTSAKPQKTSAKKTSAKKTSAKKTSATKRGSISKKEGKKVPKVTLKTRVRDPKLKGTNPYKWEDKNTHDLFKDKTSVVLSLPGAFTPTCSNKQLPEYEKKYNEFKKHGVDDVYCLSVNDAFVMKNWGDRLGIKNVKMLPDGSGKFTEMMDALVKKDNLGFGNRSWRYSMLVKDGKIVKVFEEPGQQNNCPTDPFEKSDAQTMLKYLKQHHHNE